MKEVFIKPTLFTRIEFWTFTTIFAFILFFFVIDAVDGPSSFEETPYKSFFEGANVPFYYYENYFIPQLIRHLALFFSFMLLNFLIIPNLLKKTAVLRNVGLLLLVYCTLVVIYGVTGTYLQGYLYAGKDPDDINQLIFREVFGDAFIVFFVVAVYTAIKYAGIYLVHISETIESRYQFIRKEAIIATGVWLAGILMLRIVGITADMLWGWIILIPSAILLYVASFHWLIPRALARSKYPFLSYVLKCAAIFFFAFLFMYFLLNEDDNSVAGWIAFNSLFQFFVTMPVTWLLYKKHIKGNEEISVLKKELKQSSANIDFLRSQINPHFLFNALNTLYGTAIQENADRTGEGIQKLGDMMRFMLQENMQEKISLAREVDYLNNYIDLQKLRTDSIPSIQIQTEISQKETMNQIAPMLLIPFVENAFKHGISFREPSHIKVTLEIKDNTIYFDVYNSKHTRQDNDPERDKSGIGLENVKQRLQLLYRNKHELIIRETTKEFFVHLTMQLV